MRIWTTGLALLLAGCATPTSVQPSAIKPLVLSSQERERVRTAGARILFWDEATRSKNFRAMEATFPGTTAKAGTAKPLPVGEPLRVDPDAIDQAMAAGGVTGLMVLQDGRVRLERYRDGYGPTGRWTSFSVAKSFTSTLVGAAVEDGLIQSIDDPITRYLPELAGSAYDGVSVKQVLTMTSGVKWNEDYTDPASDVVRMLSVPAPAGRNPVLAYLATLPREAAPGTKFVYKTGETNLIGVLVQRVFGRPMTEVLEEKIWRPAGMASDLFWMVDETGQNIGGCCLSASLSDYARFGEWVRTGGRGVVPAGWFAAAGRNQVPGEARAGQGYGYQWWTYPDGEFGAQGIFGQSITLDPRTRTVVAVSGNWPRATGAKLWAQRRALVARLIAAE